MAHSFVEDGMTTWEVAAEDMRLTVVPQRGAIVTGWRCHGQELLYLDRQTLVDPSKNVRGGIPVLFPLCGPLREGRYELDGRSLALGQHGFARQTAFSVVEHGEDFLELRLSASPETRSGYPFEFELRQRYRLAQGRLWLEQKVTNHSEQALPFQSGYHPYFQVGPDKQIEWRLPVETYRDNETAERLLTPYAGAIDLHGGVIDWEFHGVLAREASFRDRQRGLTVTVGYGPEFPYLVVWSVPGKPFVCLEPWSSPRFGMNDAVDLFRLAPGEVLQTRVWLTASPDQDLEKT